MISVSGFREKDLRIWKKMHKITNNSIKNRGSNLILNKSGRVHQRNVYTRFATNLCIGLRDGQKWVKQRSVIKRVNIGTE